MMGKYAIFSQGEYAGEIANASSCESALAIAQDKYKESHDAFLTDERKRKKEVDSKGMKFDPKDFPGKSFDGRVLCRELPDRAEAIEAQPHGAKEMQPWKQDLAKQREAELQRVKQDAEAKVAK
jgi:hypothetical protein